MTATIQVCRAHVVDGYWVIFNAAPGLGAVSWYLLHPEGINGPCAFDTCPAYFRLERG